MAGSGPVPHNAGPHRRTPHTMPLRYLDFDHSEDAEGNGTWDAMASVTPQHLDALLGEISAVLAWAHAHYPGPCGPLDEGGDWHFDLQALSEDGSTPPPLHYDAGRAQACMPLPLPTPARCTVTLTLCGSSAFGAALRERFGL